MDYAIIAAALVGLILTTYKAYTAAKAHNDKHAMLEAIITGIEKAAETLAPGPAMHLENTIKQAIAKYGLQDSVKRFMEERKDVGA